MSMSFSKRKLHFYARGTINLCMQKNDIGKAISIGLSRKHMTQKTLSEEIGVGANLVNRWVKGEAVPGGDNLIKIIDLLEIHNLIFPNIEKIKPPGEPVTTGMLKEEVEKINKETQQIKEEVSKLIKANPPPKKERRKIVCVDDDIFAHVLINEVLIAERFDYDLERATDPAKAMALIRKHIDKLDLIILDLDFGVQNFTGIDILEIVSRNRSLEHVPIMVFSARDNLIEKAKKYRIAEIYKKPFDYSRFTRKLAELGLVSSRKEHRTIRVLVVDDSREELNYLSMLLKKIQGVKVSIAENYEDAKNIIARRALGKKPIDLVILDLVMPNNDSVKVLEKKVNGIDFFLISAYKDTLKKVNDTRVLKKYTKPITSENIAEMIDLYCKKNNII